MGFLGRKRAENGRETSELVGPRNLTWRLDVLWLVSEWLVQADW